MGTMKNRIRTQTHPIAPAPALQAQQLKAAYAGAPTSIIQLKSIVVKQIRSRVSAFWNSSQ